MVAALAAATVVALALPAGANTGHVDASQTCDGWWAKVTLDNNVTADHYVEVTTTIPGTSGITDGHYDTTGNSGTQVIWSASGDQPTHGTVTLTILKPNKSFDTGDEATLHMVKHCNDYETTTSTSTSTSTSTTSTSTSTSTSTTSTSTTTTMPQGGPTTSTTEAPIVITSTSEASTTSTSAPTSSTTQPQSTTSFHEQGSTTVTTAHTTTSINPGGIHEQQLPFTGSGSLFAGLFGVSCLAGGALLVLRHRRTIWTMRK
jgi:LPXTG-motif cell wall-anchored protein